MEKSVQRKQNSVPNRVISVQECSLGGHLAADLGKPGLEPADGCPEDDGDGEHAPIKRMALDGNGHRTATAGRGIYSEWGWSMSSALAPAIESLCGSIPRYSIPAMSGIILVVASPFGGAGAPLIYGKAAEPNQLQP